MRAGSRLWRGLLLAAALLAPVRAEELQWQSWFIQPPWRVEFRSYYSTVMQTAAEYYFTVALPQQAGADLGGLLIQQTRGVDLADRHISAVRIT